MYLPAAAKLSLSLPSNQGSSRLRRHGMTRERTTDYFRHADHGLPPLFFESLNGEAPESETQVTLHKS